MICRLDDSSHLRFNASRYWILKINFLNTHIPYSYCRHSILEHYFTYLFVHSRTFQLNYRSYANRNKGTPPRRARTMCLSFVTCISKFWGTRNELLSVKFMTPFHKIILGYSTSHYHTAKVYIIHTSWKFQQLFLSLIHIWRCRRSTLCRSRWSPYH